MNRLVQPCCLLAILHLVVVVVGGEESPAADPLGTQTVAEVNGSTITLRQLENSILEKEGLDLLVDLVRQRLRETDWDEVHNDEMVLAIGDWRLSREVLVAQLLRRHGGQVRGDLIDTLLAEQALRKAGVVIDQELLKAEYARIARAFRDQSMAQTGAIIPFEEWLKEKKGMGVGEFMADPAFRMLAGLHRLVYLQSEIPEHVLKDFFREHYQDFARDEQVDLSVISIPYANPSLIIDRDKEKLRQTLEASHRRIQAGKRTFAEEFRLLGRAYDKLAERTGRVGWVAADGVRPQARAPALPAPVMKAAFAMDFAEGDKPILLRPIATDAGVYLVRLQGRRPALNPTFKQIAKDVRAAYIEANLDALTARLQRRLKREAEVEFHSLADLVNQRWRSAAGTGSEEGGVDQPKAPEFGD